MNGCSDSNCISYIKSFIFSFFSFLLPTFSWSNVQVRHSDLTTCWHYREPYGEWSQHGWRWLKTQKCDSISNNSTVHSIQLHVTSGVSDRVQGAHHMQRTHTTALISLSAWWVKVPLRGDRSRGVISLFPDQHFQEQFCFIKKSNEWSYW